MAPTKETASKKVASKAGSRPRRRSTKKTAPTTGGAAAAARRESTQKVQQLAVLALAILLGLIGLAVHFFWIPAIVLMSVLFGLVASELRGQRGGGVISEVATTVMAEAKSVADGISDHGAREAEPKGSS